MSNHEGVTDDGVEIRTKPDWRRFEILKDGKSAGFATFRDMDNVRVFLHTEIDPAFEGQGLGGKLIREALDQTWALGKKVDPQCPFVRNFIARHQEYADLVVDSHSPNR